MLVVMVGGMTCGHCVKAVTKAVDALPGVERVEVDLAAGRVSVTGAVDPALVRKAIETEGYTLA
jgi:copper chaperone CopZ